MEHINQVAFQKISKVQEHMASAPRLASRLANLLTTKVVSRLATPKQVGQYEIRWPRNLKRSMYTTWRKKKWNSGHEDFYASKCPLDQSKIHVMFLSIKLLKFVRTQYMRNSIFRFSSRLLLERPISKR